MQRGFGIASESPTLLSIFKGFRELASGCLGVSWVASNYVSPSTWDGFFGRKAKEKNAMLLPWGERNRGVLERVETPTLAYQRRYEQDFFPFRGGAVVTLPIFF